MTGPEADRRHSSPPEVVERWVERWAGVPNNREQPDPTARALAALTQARIRTGRDREAAQALLAADALLTARVEDIAAADDPEGGLVSLLRLVVCEVDS